MLQLRLPRGSTFDTFVKKKCELSKQQSNKLDAGGMGTPNVGWPLHSQIPKIVVENGKSIAHHPRYVGKWLPMQDAGGLHESGHENTHSHPPTPCNPSRCKSKSQRDQTATHHSCLGLSLHLPPVQCSKHCCSGHKNTCAVEPRRDKGAARIQKSLISCLPSAGVSSLCETYNIDFLPV